MYTFKTWFTNRAKRQIKQIYNTLLVDIGWKLEKYYVCQLVLMIIFPEFYKIEWKKLRENVKLIDIQI